MGWWTASRKNYALSYLMRAGLSPYGAAGLVSRWANVESIANGPTAVNPYSGAFGIAQWLGSRLPPIRGNTNFDAQLAYVVQELNGPEARAGNILRTASSAYQGALGASVYERAEGYNSQTGVDNFTSKTANGVAAILRTLPQAAPVTQAATAIGVNPVIPFARTSYVNSNGDILTVSEANSALQTGTGVLLVGTGLLILYLISQ